MSPIDSAHTNGWQTGEAVFGIPFLAAIALQFLVPLSLPRGPFGLVFTLVGVVLIVMALAFIVLARREFAQRAQPTDPGRPTTALVTTGVFSISGNPLYLGAACFLAGVALAFNLPWGLIMLLPGLVACHLVLIAPEERYLRLKFGDEYRAYTAAVHRWIGRAK